MKMLCKSNIDYKLAYHIAALFLRAPVPAYEHELEFPEELNHFVEQLRAKQKAKEEFVDETRTETEDEKSEESKSMHSGCERD